MQFANISVLFLIQGTLAIFESGDPTTKQLRAINTPRELLTIGAGSCLAGGCIGATASIGAGSCTAADSCNNAGGLIGAGTCTAVGSCNGATASIGAGACTGIDSCVGATGLIAAGTCTAAGSCAGTTETRYLQVNLACAAGGKCDINNGVAGVVKFFPPTIGENDGLTTIEYEISGLVPFTYHGMHVHTEIITDGATCEDAGGHYNPMGVNHGTTLSAQRHPGDMGSVLSNAHGVAEGTMTAETPLFKGNSRIVGRSVVLHEVADDNGLGGDDSSRANGKAGKRIACGNLDIVTH